MRYKVTLAYDGSNYHGWQTQQRGCSIQEQVENVLRTIHKGYVKICASGRTDAGVHALGQVFHFDSPLQIPAENWKTAMNALLPKDIRIKQVEVVKASFHARFDATGKRYDYYLTRDMENPFVDRYMGKESVALDVVRMREAALYLLGKHDFTSFTSSKIDERKSRVKEVRRLAILEEDDVVHFIIEGSSFLRYMVRMIVQTLIEVGKYKLHPEDVKEMLEKKDKHICRYKADAQGLYLVEVYYE